MRYFGLILVFSILVSIIPVYSISFGDNSVKNIAKEVGPAVVNIDSIQYLQQRRRISDPFFERLFGNRYEENNIIPLKGSGSGFIVDKSGLIFTNQHVIENASEIIVTFSNEQKLKAKVIVSDPENDLALIKFDVSKLKYKNIPVVKMANSKKVEVGDWVVAIGSPFGLQKTVTVGVVSALHRSLPISDNRVYSNLIQTDAAINRGNSGGPLINSNGEVIGINSAIIPYAQGICFAIPINMAKKIIKDYKEFGQYRRPWLGVSIQELNEKLKDYFKVKTGVLVNGVIPGSAADNSGIKRGDIIYKINGITVTSTRFLSATIQENSAGEKIYINIIRNGKNKIIKAILGDKKGRSYSKNELDNNIQKDINRFGIFVRSMSPREMSDANIDKGVIIEKVKKDSDAYIQGLRPGYIIIQANNTEIKGIEDYKKEVENSKDQLVIVVKNGESVRYFIISN